MGSGGSTYTPPPATPMPVEDSVAARRERAALMAERSQGASLANNQLDSGNADKQDAVTRSRLGDVETFKPQKQPRGPRKAPGSMMPKGGMGNSAVITG